jgi:hypothetical protein
MLPKNVLYYGRDQEPPAQVRLRAGPLKLLYENGDLRTIRWGDAEVLRRIYVAVRDRNWGTIPPVLSNVQIEAREQDFHISYQVTHHQGEIHFEWQGEIAGDEQGMITCTLDGIAQTTFWRNRIGFCILHPASAAGAACRVEHLDGSWEDATLPELISPEQPVPPFGEMRSLAHQLRECWWAQVRFSGDVFEMEDQRNWTDASYKTFSTPLRLPYPVQIQAGTRIQQSIRLSLQVEGSSPIAAPSARRKVAPKPITITLRTGTPPLPLPPIGLGCASHNQPLTKREIERLKALNLAHLRLDLDLSTAELHHPGWMEKLGQAASEAKSLGLPLEIALLVPMLPGGLNAGNGEAETALRSFREALERIRPRVKAWLIYPKKEIFTGGSPTREAVLLARKHLQDYDPAIPFAAGANTDLIFLQRTPPPLDLLEAVTFAINPQVHAFDNTSLVETLQAQGAAVKTAQRLAGRLPVRVSPVTLKPRHNPYATGDASTLASGDLPPQVDPRQMSLFGAGWTLGSLKSLAESGVSSLTYYETTGWRGVMELESGSPLPEAFASIPGGVFPLYHVLAWAGGFSGGEVLPCLSSDPLRVDALALRQDQRLRLLLANHTPEPQGVALPDLGRPARVCILDETNAEAAMLTPEGFRQAPGKALRPKAGACQVELLSYAVMRVDCEPGRPEE